MNGMDAFSDAGDFLDRLRDRTKDLKDKLCDSESEKIDVIKDYFKENGKDFNETFSNIVKGF